MRLKKAYDCIVVGAGPAGMMAAGRAAERLRRVLLIEKKEIPGKKLLISGKGRCNITNCGTIEEHISNFGKTGNFLRNAFSRVFNKELSLFFEKYDVPLKTERGQRVFPESGRSKDVLDALKRYLKENRVDILYSTEVKDIEVRKDGLKTVSVSDGAKYEAQSVAICTGGLSYPQTGSTGFGFDIAKSLGHNVIPPKPALVGLITEVSCKALQGLSLENVEATIIADGRKSFKCFGDIIFTHYGLSGPIILDLSFAVYDFLFENKEVFISINLKPKLDTEKLNARLIREFTKTPNRSIRNVLGEMLPQKMTQYFIERAGVNKDKMTNQISREERNRIVTSLLDLKFKIKATRPLIEAIVTRGGVDTKEINPKTMESRFIDGLFFAGEIIDIDGKTGGYNMQAAFSTGFLCGDNL